MDGDDVINCLRWQAWERAKGELEAMLHAYYGEQDEFDWLSNRIKKFIKEVEEEIL